MLIQRKNWTFVWRHSRLKLAEISSCGHRGPAWTWLETGGALMQASVTSLKKWNQSIILHRYPVPLLRRIRDMRGAQKNVARSCKVAGASSNSGSKCPDVYNSAQWKQMPVIIIILRHDYDLDKFIVFFMKGYTMSYLYALTFHSRKPQVHTFKITSPHMGTWK